MAYMLTKAEQEVVISKCADETEWTIYSTDPRETTRFRQLAKRTGGTEFAHQGGTKFTIPVDQLRITAKRQVTLTEEHWAKLRANIQAARSKVLTTA